MLQAVQLDFYAQERRIFWVDAQVNELKRVGLIGSPIETVVDTAIAKPNGTVSLPDSVQLSISNIYYYY